MKKITFFLMAIISSAISEIHAQIIHVPVDQLTIQAGIDAASNGDIVLVDTGTYKENINFRGKAIIVASNFFDSGDTNDINNTIIDGSIPANNDSAAVVMFTSGEDTTSVICGFTLTKGTGLYVSSWNMRMGGAVACLDAGAKIINNKIIGNETIHSYMASGGGIGGMFLTMETWIVIEDNTISGNTCIATDYFSNGGGIFIAANARIDNNTIENNESHCDLADADGGGVMIDNASGGNDTVYMRGNLIRNNIVSAYDRGRGGGVFSVFTNMYIFDNTITHNSVYGDMANGGGILCNSNMSVDISNNTISFNTAVTDNIWFGAGILCVIPKGKSIFRNNMFEGNAGPIYSNYPQTVLRGDGGGLSLLDPYLEEVIVDGNFFKNDTAKLGGGCYITNAWNIELSNNVFIDNYAYHGGAIRLYEYTKNGTSSDMQVDSLCPLIVNNSFLKNKAIDLGGSIFSAHIQYPPVIFNNIFWESQAVGGGNDIYLDGSDEVLIAHCNTIDSNIFGNWTGYANNYEDPLFIQGDDSLHITDTSPCHTTGIESVTYNSNTYFCPPYDYEGDLRPGLDCHDFDMGADEIFKVCVGIENHLLPTSDKEINLKNYPNPFSSTITIEYKLTKLENVQITVLNYLGQQVETIDQGLQSGRQQYVWDTSKLPNGIYFVKVRTGQEMATRKIVKVR